MLYNNFWNQKPLLAFLNETDFIGHKTLGDIDAARLFPDMHTEILMPSFFFFFFFHFPDSVDAHQRSYELGIQIGHQRRNKDVLAWVKKRRRTIRREDLISFLCGKTPPPRSSRAPPRLAMVSPSRPTSSETSSSVETDLQPFREAIALHGECVWRQCHLIAWLL